MGFVKNGKYALNKENKSLRKDTIDALTFFNAWLYK